MPLFKDEFPSDKREVKAKSRIFEMQHLARNDGHSLVEEYEKLKKDVIKAKRKLRIFETEKLGLKKED
ncbi:hypothetical protein HYT01_00235 [Candidatus Giovannonibacteria bacterium]|nr:hypothetical protein [Candidatus Giovannonibacteria bacterium]